MKGATATRVRTFFFQNRSLALHKNAASRVLFFLMLAHSFCHLPVIRHVVFFLFSDIFFCVWRSYVWKADKTRVTSLFFRAAYH